MKKKYKAMIILSCVFIFLFAVYGVLLLGTISSSNKVESFAKDYEKVEYEDQLTPLLDEDNNYYFVTDRKVKIMQITDMHIGGGLSSYSKDIKAINAVAAMVNYEKPDLVILTGDQVFPVPFISLNNNNQRAFKAIAAMFESLGVYWTAVFGNHDSEIYSSNTRKGVASLYGNAELKYCLFRNNYSGSITGECNQIINFYHTNGLINKTLYLVDSNDYQNRLLCGIDGKYDNVHQDQIDWYEENVQERIAYNKNVLSSLGEELINKENYLQAQSFVFLHIPLYEYKVASDLYKNNDPSVIYNFGRMGEDVACSNKKDNFFATMVKYNSTKGVFCGHDHINNISLKYQGIDLIYGMSIDYLAYRKISQYGLQRGCTILELNEDASYQIHQENYYQDKYVSKLPKENVNLVDYYNK